MEQAHAAPAFAPCLGALRGSRVGRSVARGWQEGTLRHWNSIMMSALLAAPFLAGCPGGDDTGTGANDSSSGEDPTTTTTDTPTTTGVDSSSGEPTTTGDTGGCPEDAEIPPAPVDCSGADGVIMGSVIIDDEGGDPSMLEGVRRVEGSIVISGTDLTDLNFMACVAEVTGEITLFNNDALTNVDGLWSITEIGTDFVFSQNDALVDFNGLPNLGKINHNLIMNENAALEGISGLQSLVGFEGDTMINMMGQEVFFGGNLTIQQNPVLQHMDGFVGTLVLNGVFAVTNNPMLCLSSVGCVGTGIVQPAEPPESWSTVGNNPDC